MITVSAVGKSHGARTLFRDVSLQVVRGRRIALVGPNGVGKTTLLDMIAGEQAPDEGTVSRAKDAVVGYLRQEVAETAGRSVLAEVVAAAADVKRFERRMRELEERLAGMPVGDEQESLLDEYGHIQQRFEHAGGYAVEADARRILAGLGFAADDLARDVGQLSGGWMMRVALARLLLAGPDVLLLDEPTNHLDLDSVSWLEEFLAAYDGAIVVVSHDRDFINRIANRVVEFANLTTTEYVGNYADFVEQRELRLEQLRNAAANQQRKIAQTERFIERFRYKSTLASRVQSRVKALDRLERIAIPEERRRQLRFRFPDPPRSGRDVIRLREVTKRYGEKTVYEGLDLVLERGQKVALVGPNGAGKSTLLKILAGVLPLDGGRRELGHNVTVAYFAQHQIDALDLERTVLEELSSAVDTSTVNPRSMLGAFLFSGEAVDKRVGVLSGGEKSRLALARMLARPANLLCMDEPTNHLDLPSRDVLEDALVEYPGTVVLITHDRHLIRSVANTVIDVRGGGATVYPGDFAYYAAKTGLDLDGSGLVSASPPVAQRAPGAPSGRREQDVRRAEAERRNRIHRATKELKAKVARIEEELGRVEAEIANLHRRLADPEVYGDGEEVRRLSVRHGEAKDRATALTDEWERASLALEDVAARAERSMSR